MSDRRTLLYFAWSRPDEINAPFTAVNDRFPAIFELRRLFYPKFEPLSGPEVDQGIAGFLDHVQKPNFKAFADHATALTGHPVSLAERVADDGQVTALDDGLIAQTDTIVVISFDSLRTRQVARASEIEAVRRFLAVPDHVIVICPHHDIGEGGGLPEDMSGQSRILEHEHHGDRAIPPRQGFGGFARTLLAGLGTPVENRFGLRPAAEPDGSPSPIEVERALDELLLLHDVETFNLHPHLPQLERVGDAIARMDVLARQRIDMTAPSHPFTRDGRTSFDALLQSRAETFAGKLLVCDTTMFSSTAGGTDNLRRLWSNLLLRPHR